MKRLLLLLCLCSIGAYGAMSQSNHFKKTKKYLDKRKFDKAIMISQKRIAQADTLELSEAWFWLGEANRRTYFHKVKEVRLKDDAGYYALDSLLDNAINAYQQSWLMQGKCYSIIAAERLNELEHFIHIIANRYLDLKKEKRFAKSIERALRCNEFACEQQFGMLDTALVFAGVHAAEINGDTANVAKIYEQLIELGASDILVYERASDFYLNLGDTLKAVETLDYATLLFPESFAVYKLNLETLLRIGFWEQAFAEIDLGTKRYDRKIYEMNYLKAKCYHQAYQQDALSDVQKEQYFVIAEENYILSNKIMPENYDCIIGLADLYYRHLRFLAGKKQNKDTSRLTLMTKKSNAAQKLAVFLKAKEDKDVLSTIHEMELREKILRQQ